MQISTDPTIEKRILVAGECTTQGGFNSDPSTDAFLLEIKPETGVAIQRDVFFLQENVENGALYDYDGFRYPVRTEGKLDLHLTRDHHAVIMGNAKVTLDEADDAIIPTSSGQNNPYLVERYDTVLDKCFDERSDIPTKKYEFARKNARTIKGKIKGRNLKVKTEKVELSQEIVCEKKEEVSLFCS